MTLSPFEALTPGERYSRAHNAIAGAIRKGQLARPVNCEQCGKKGKIEAAHYDYRDVLRVRWLCRPCHCKWDREEPKNAREGMAPRLSVDTTKGIQKTIRFEDAEYEQLELEREAVAADRKFADYLRHLIKTHPMRKKK